MPAEIADIRFHFNYDNPSFCKFSKLLSYMSVMGSEMTLLTIAVDRFRKVCRPFGSQIEPRHIKCVVLFITVFTIMSALPTVFVYGQRTTEIKRGDTIIVTDKTCAISDDYLHINLRSIYHNVLFLFVIVIIVCLVAIYIYILRAIQTSQSRVKGNPNAKINLEKKKIIPTPLDSNDRVDIPMDEVIADKNTEVTPQHQDTEYMTENIDTNQSKQRQAEKPAPKRIILNGACQPTQNQENYDNNPDPTRNNNFTKQESANSLTTEDTTEQTNEQINKSNPKTTLEQTVFSVTRSKPKKTIASAQEQKTAVIGIHTFFL